LEQVARNASDAKRPPSCQKMRLIASLLARRGRPVPKVGALYGRLAELDLDPARCEHYARVKLRYQNVADAPLETLPAIRAR
jgi:hypothetical protein